MNKRLLDLRAWHWRADPLKQPGQQVMHLMAVLLLIPGVLLVLSGILKLDPSQIAVGALSLLAGLVIERQQAQG